MARSPHVLLAAQVRASVAPAVPDTATVPDQRAEVRPALPWVTIVWNDPVNTMSYVSYVFRSYFGYGREKAEELMLDVHHKGKAVVSTGPRDRMERDVEAMHEFGLWATLQQDD